MEWIPYLLAASPAGIINVLAEWSELDKKCRWLPFFKPIQSFGFWVWLFMQFSIPSCVAWFLFSFSGKPTIGWELIFNVSVLGLVFVAVLNATTEIGSLPINIKPLYDFFINLAYNRINNEQNAKANRFWNKVEQELSQTNFKNLSILENYFLENKFLVQPKKEVYQNIINEIANSQKKEDKIKKIISLLKEVRRENLPEMLEDLNVREEFLKQYFPKKYPK